MGVRGEIVGIEKISDLVELRDGLTVIARLGDLPVLGQTDITLEATVAGAVLGLRATLLVLCGALYTSAVDPDEVLRLFRRFSFHSALSATLATRMVPVLTRDARRLAEAQRCRPGPASCGSAPGMTTVARLPPGTSTSSSIDPPSTRQVTSIWPNGPS